MKTSWWLLGLVGCLSLGLVGPVGASQQGQRPSAAGKGDAKPTVIQIDLSKLPPDVAKRLLDLASQADTKKKDAKKSEAPKKDGKGKAGESGFQGEQTGQHEDKEDGKGKKNEGNRKKDEKGNDKAGAGDSQGQQTGQQEDNRRSQVSPSTQRHRSGQQGQRRNEDQ